MQTIGFRDGLWIDLHGSPMSDAAKMTERLRRPNYGTLEVEITVDDPKVYTRPWTVRMDQVIELDTDLIDEFRLENEKSYKGCSDPAANRNGAPNGERDDRRTAGVARGVSPRMRRPAPSAREVRNPSKAFRRDRSPARSAEESWDR